MGNGGDLAGVKPTVREAGHTPPCFSEVKNDWYHTSSPYAFIACIMTNLSSLRDSSGYAVDDSHFVTDIHLEYCTQTTSNFFLTDKCTFY